MMTFTTPFCHLVQPQHFSHSSPSSSDRTSSGGSLNLRIPRQPSVLKNVHIDAGKFSNLCSRFAGLTLLQAILSQPAVTIIHSKLSPLN